MEELQISTIDKTQYESILVNPDHHDVVSDLTNQLQDRLKDIEVLKQDREGLKEKLESLQSQYEVSNLLNSHVLYHSVMLLMFRVTIC